MGNDQRWLYKTIILVNSRAKLMLSLIDGCKVLQFLQCLPLNFKRLKTECRWRSKFRVMEFNSGFCPHLWTCPCLLTTTLIKHLTDGYLGLCPCLLTIKLSSFCLSLYLSLALLYMIQKDLQQGVRTTVVAIVLDLIFCN